LEAARLLGKSPRQIRYMLKQGELKGEKVEGRWVFDDAKLPRSPAQERARQQKTAELEAAVNEGLDAVVRKPRGRGYSVGDLVAFRTGAAACREAARRFGDEHRATVAMCASVVARSDRAAIAFTTARRTRPTPVPARKPRPPWRCCTSRAATRRAPSPTRSKRTTSRPSSGCSGRRDGSVPDAHPRRDRGLARQGAPPRPQGPRGPPRALRRSPALPRLRGDPRWPSDRSQGAGQVA
jgi:hypothetical protein